jgi:hypothetical protein
LHNIGKKRRKKSGERTEEITTKREGRWLVVKNEKERARERGKKDREERERRRVEEVVKTKVSGRRIFRRRDGVDAERENKRKRMKR